MDALSSSESASWTESAVKRWCTASSYCCGRASAGQLSSSRTRAHERTHPSVHVGDGEVEASANVARVDVDGGEVVLHGEVRLARVGERRAEAVEQERVLRVDEGVRQLRLDRREGRYEAEKEGRTSGRTESAAPKQSLAFS